MLSENSRLGHYEIIRMLGKGGMGEVYIARDLRLRRSVAIKILPQQFSSNSDRLKRFEAEARAASILNHPNIVTVYDVGTVDGNFYIAMEFIDGKTLQELIHSGAILPKKALQIAHQIAEGLARAHDAGIVHRDLKPENIIVTHDGICKILDFGLAKIHNLLEEEVSNFSTIQRTQPGHVLGTVGYMSPEQASGEPATFASDQFSFGSIMYEMVTGQKPFKRKTAAETLSAIINEDPAPIRNLNPNFAPPFRWIIERCLAKDAKNRFASTQDLAQQLKDLSDHLSELEASTERIAPKNIPGFKNAWIYLSLLIIALLAGVLIWQLRIGERQRLPEYHRLTYRRGLILSARFAPDGQTIVYTARWNGGKSQLFQTRTEGTESLPLNVEGAKLVGISSLGEMALLLHFQGGIGTLAKMPLTGGSLRELAENISAADWSVDGKMLAIARKTNHWRLEYPIGKVLYDSDQFIRHVRISHNGKFIAIIEGIRVGNNGRVLIFDANGKRLAMVTKELWPELPIWREDDSGVLFSGFSPDPGGGYYLHEISLRNELRLVNRYPGETILFDVFPSGDAIFRVGDARQLCFGIFPGQTKEQEISWLDRTEVSDLSPDGSLILLHETGEGSESPGGSVYIRKTDGSPAIHLGAGTPSVFSPDKKWVACSAGPDGMYLLPTGVGEKKLLPPHNLEFHIDARFASGKSVVYLGQEKGKNQRLYLQDIDTGSVRPITPATQNVLNIGEISPDRKFIFGYTDEKKWIKYSIVGGEPEVFTNMKENDFPILWNSDGRHILIGQQPTEQLPLRIFKLDSLSGKREIFKEIMPLDPVGFEAWSFFVTTPDFKYYAYSYGRNLCTLYLVKQNNW